MRSVSHDDLTLFTRQIAVMHMAGLSLPRALDFYARSGKSEMCRVALDICTHIEQGHKFSAALSRRPDVFSMVYVGLVECAESSGELRPVLLKIAELLERQLGMRQRLIALMTYPAVLIGVSGIAVAGFTIFVLPLMTPMFTSMHMQLPWLTRMLVAIASFVRSPLTLVVCMSVAALLSWQFARLRRQVARWEGLVRRWHKLLLTTPLIGPAVQKIVAARILYVMAAQLDAGMYTGQVLDRTARVAGNLIIAERIRAASVDVKSGDPISTAMERQDILPRGALYMIRAGEESAQLAQMLQRAGTIYEEEVEITLANLTVMLEPIVLLGLGVGVAVVVVAAMLPTVQLLQNL